MQIKNLHKIIVLVIGLLITNFAFTQTEKELEELKEKADNLFDDEKYIEARKEYQVLLERNQTSPEINFRYGACLLYTEEDKMKGLGHLQFAVQNANIDERAYYFLGKAYHLNFRFNEAITQYNTFKSKASGKTFERLAVERQIKMCNSGKKLLKNLSEIVVVEKKEAPLSKFQYSYNLESKEGKILVTTDFQSKYDKKIGHRALVHFPKNMQNNIFYSSYGKDGSNGKDLYQIRRLPNGDWAEPQKLPDHINTDADDDYGFMHPDGLSFYFCSQGHNSMGGYDIFKCTYNRGTNSYGPPVNLDFKINSPADDIMYVVDSLDVEAHFSSSRAATGGYVDVYKVKVETFPVLNVVLAGAFINDITPSNKSITIKVEDVVSGEMTGVFNTKKDRGNYLVILPKSGKFKYYVESPESEIVHTGIIDIPYQKEFKPLKQELVLFIEGGEEKLNIRNLFDEDVDDIDAIMAEYFKQISDPEPNLKQFEDRLGDSANIEAVQAVIGSDLTPEDLIAIADTTAAETAREAKKIEEQRDAAYFVANKKLETAKVSAEKAEEILEGIDKINNPDEKTQLVALAKDLSSDAKRDNKIAIDALNLGKNLDKEVTDKQAEAAQASKYATDIKDALNSTDKETAIQKLTELKDFISQSKSSTNDKDALDEAENRANIAEVDYKNAQKRVEDLNAERSDVQQELSNIKRERDNAKPNDKSKFDVRVNDTQEILSQLERDIAKAKESTRQKLEAYENSQGEVELLRDFNNNLASADGKLTDEELVKLKSDMEDGSLTASIAKSENTLANTTIENDTDTLVVDNGPSSEERINWILSNTNYQDSDSLKTYLDNISNPTVRAERWVEINNKAVNKIDEDIVYLNYAIEEETDPTRKTELEQKKVDLENKRTNFLSENEASNKVINAPNTFIDTEANANFENRLSGLGDTDIDVIKKKEILTDWIVKLDNDAAALGLELLDENDEKKQSEMQDAISELKFLKRDKEKEIEALNDVVITSPESDYNISSIVSDEEYDGFEAEIASHNSISAPVERAKAKNVTINQWIDVITADKQELEALKPEATAEQLSDINNMIERLDATSVKLEKDVVQNLEEIAEANQVETPESEYNISSIVSDEEYDGFETEIAAHNSISAPVERAKAKNVTINQWIDVIASDKQELEALKTEATEDQLSDINNMLERLEATSSKLENDLEENLAIIKADSEAVSTLSPEEISEKITKVEDRRENVLEKTSTETIDAKLAEFDDIEDPVEKAEKQNEQLDAYRKILQFEGAITESNAENEENTELKAAYLNSVDEIKSRQVVIENQIAANDELIANPPENIATKENPTTFSKENTFDYSAGQEDFKFEESKNIINSKSKEIEELKDEQQKLQALEIKLRNADENETVKIEKDISDKHNEIADIEVEIANTYAKANVNEFNETKAEIAEAQNDLSSASTEISEKVTALTNQIESANNQIDQAALLRTEAENETDLQLKNNILKQAAKVESEAIASLYNVSSEMEVLVNENNIANENTTNGTNNDNTNEFLPDATSIAQTTPKNISVANNDAISSQAASNELVDIEDELATIDEYDTQIKRLQNEAAAATNDKDKDKIAKQIEKIEKKKAKTNIKAADAIAAANTTQFNQTQNINEVAKADAASINNATQTSAFNEGKAIEDLAENQFIKATDLRNEASTTKDKLEKSDMYEDANEIEKMAITNIKMANDRYKQAVIEGANQSYEGRNPIIEDNQDDRLSTQQLDLASRLQNEANAMSAESVLLADSANLIKDKTQKNALLAKSEELDEMAATKSQLANQLQTNANQLSAQEDRILEEQQLLDDLTDESIANAKKSPIYRDAYVEHIKGVEEINSQIDDLATEKKNFKKLADADKADARDLLQNAAIASTPVEQANFLKSSQVAANKAKLNQAKADSIDRLIDELYASRAEKLVAQDEYLSSLSDTELASTIKALSISDLDKEPMAVSISADTSLITSGTFEVPEVITEDIAIINRNQQAPTYSDDNPIPLNPKMPSGIIFRVQVGAFRNPIPQDLFKGFAPLTGEKVRDDITRYRAGYFIDYTNANNAKNEIRAMGYSDAFVVAVKDGQYMNLAEARRAFRNGDVAMNANSNNENTTQENSTAVNTNNETTANTNTETTTNNENESTSNASNETNANTTYYDELENAPDAQPIEVVQGLFYTVQIGAYSKEVRASDLNNIQPLNVKLAPNGLLRYSTGRYDDIPAARARKIEVQNNGIPDAFVTVYYNGERITFAEAERLIAENGSDIFSTGQDGTTRLVETPSTNQQKVDGLDYIVDLGTYEGQAPTSVSVIILKYQADKNLERELSEDVLKLTYGPLGSYQSAFDKQAEFEKAGIPKARLVPVYNGKEISIEEAQQLENRVRTQPSNTPTSTPENTSTTPIDSEDTENVAIPNPNNDPAIAATNAVVEDAETVVYKVFLGNYPEGNTSLTRANTIIQIAKDPKMVDLIKEDDGSRTYMYGKTNSYTQAQTNQLTFAEAGVTEALVVAFLNGEEISIEEALRTTNE